jgi:hypothetical protein
MKPYATFLLSTVAGLCIAGAAQAAAPAQIPLPPAQSYADLLEPVQNAEAALLADDIAHAQQQKPLLQLAQWHHHHHHHHHHHGFFPGFGITIAPPVVYGPDCYWRRRVWVDRWGYEHVRRVRVCD